MSGVLAAAARMITRSPPVPDSWRFVEQSSDVLTVSQQFAPGTLTGTAVHATLELGPLLLVLYLALDRENRGSLRWVRGLVGCRHDPRSAEKRANDRYNGLLRPFLENFDQTALRKDRLTNFANALRQAVPNLRPNDDTTSDLLGMFFDRQLYVNESLGPQRTAKAQSLAHIFKCLKVAFPEVDNSVDALGAQLSDFELDSQHGNLHGNLHRLLDAEELVRLQTRHYIGECVLLQPRPRDPQPQGASQAVKAVMTGTAGAALAFVLGRPPRRPRRTGSRLRVAVARGRPLSNGAEVARAGRWLPRWRSQPMGRHLPGNDRRLHV